MYVVNLLPPQIDPALIVLLARAEPATIGHVLSAGFMDTGMRGLFADVRIAGTAVTVRAPGPDCTMVHFRALPYLPVRYVRQHPAIPSAARAG